MKNTLFTTLTLVTAAAAGITALALHAPKTVECTCDEHAEVLPPKPVYEFHYVNPHHHFAQPPAPEPMPMPEPTAAA